MDPWLLSEKVWKTPPSHVIANMIDGIPVPLPFSFGISLEVGLGTHLERIWKTETERILRESHEKIPVSPIFDGFWGIFSWEHWEDQLDGGFLDGEDW